MINNVNELDANPNGLSYAIWGHYAMEPIDDVDHCAVASLVTVLLAFVRHVNVSIVMNLHYAFEVVVDQKCLDLVTIVVGVFDVN